MQTKSILSADDATRIIEAARALAEQQQWAVATAVADDRGHPLALLRLDRCTPISSYFATEKARIAAITRRETKLYEDMVNAGRAAFITAPLAVSLEGGVPIIVDGHVVGAVGISGVTADQDAQVAKAGAAVTFS